MCKARKAWVLLLGAVLLAGWALPAAADAVSEQRKAQNKLLAYRAARADAIRKLAERIRGLRITSETTVSDFVATSDTIETSLRAFLNGMKEIGKPNYMEDGTCEVVMEVKLQEVIVTLKQFHKEYYKGDKIRSEDFEKMSVVNKITAIRETGSGAPRPELSEEPLVMVAQGELMGIKNLTGQARAYWTAHCTGQGRLMAVRAARVDGLRRLGERIQGVRITSTTSVRDFVAEYDEINTRLRAFIRGARERGIRYHADELIVEVEMEVTLRDLIVNLKTWHKEFYKGDRVRVQDIEQLNVRARDKEIRETGMGVPPQQYLKDVPAAQAAVLATAAKAPPWITRTEQAVGNAAVDTTNANTAQARLMALRGAELDGRRKLAEKINGLTITSNTSVRDFVAANDQIDSGMLAFQQGAYVVEKSQKVLEDGTAQVTVEIDLKPLWNMVLYYQRNLSITIR